MPDTPCTHHELHREFQLIVHHALLKKADLVAADKRKLLREREVWGPALVSAFRHLARDRLRVALCSRDRDDLAWVAGESAAGRAPSSLEGLPDESFARLVFATIDEARWEEAKDDFARVKACVRTVQSHGHGNPAAASLTGRQMFDLLEGLVFTLTFHPSFFDESRRENMIALMADRVAEDLLGAWPEGEAPADPTPGTGTGEPPAQAPRLTRIEKVSFADYFRFIAGKKNPADVWAFTVGGMPCRVVNRWRGGALLLGAGDEILAENKDLLAVKGTTPALSAEVKGPGGRTHKVDVYFRAWISVNARVEVDSQPLPGGFT